MGRNGRTGNIRYQKPPTDQTKYSKSKQKDMLQIN